MLASSNENPVTRDAESQLQLESQRSSSLDEIDLVRIELFKSLNNTATISLTTETVTVAVSHNINTIKW